MPDMKSYSGLRGGPGGLLALCGKPLPSPIRSKLFERHSDGFCRVGLCSVQGYRWSMEDAHCVHLSLPDHPNLRIIGLFDGHNGSSAAEFLSHSLSDALNQCDELDPSSVIRCIQDLDEHYCQTMEDESGATIVLAVLSPLLHTRDCLIPTPLDHPNSSSSLTKGCSVKDDADHHIAAESGTHREDPYHCNSHSSSKDDDNCNPDRIESSAATPETVIRTADNDREGQSSSMSSQLSRTPSNSILDRGSLEYEVDIYWCGDSRALWMNEFEFERVTEDHKPEREDERARIEEAGGMVYRGRVDARLSVSRAFGDRAFKKTIPLTVSIDSEEYLRDDDDEEDDDDDGDDKGDDEKDAMEGRSVRGKDESPECKSHIALNQPDLMGDKSAGIARKEGMSQEKSVSNDGDLSGYSPVKLVPPSLSFNGNGMMDDDEHTEESIQPKIAERESYRVISKCDHHRCRLRTGDSLFLYCDGLVESMDDAQLVKELRQCLPDTSQMNQDSSSVDFSPDGLKKRKQKAGDLAFSLGSLLDSILDRRLSRDNMTCALIQLGDFSIPTVSSSSSLLLPSSQKCCDVSNQKNQPDGDIDHHHNKDATQSERDRRRQQQRKRQGRKPDHPNQKGSLQSQLKRQSFLPGPLFGNRNIWRFESAYMENARLAGHFDGLRLRTAAYNEDVRLLTMAGRTINKLHRDAIDGKANVKQLKEESEKVKMSLDVIGYCEIFGGCSFHWSLSSDSSKGAKHSLSQDDAEELSHLAPLSDSVGSSSEMIPSVSELRGRMKMKSDLIRYSNWFFMDKIRKIEGKMMEIRRCIEELKQEKKQQQKSRMKKRSKKARNVSLNGGNSSGKPTLTHSSTVSLISSSSSSSTSALRNSSEWCAARSSPMNVVSGAPVRNLVKCATTVAMSPGFMTPAPVVKKSVRRMDTSMNHEMRSSSHSSQSSYHSHSSLPTKDEIHDDDDKGEQIKCDIAPSHSDTSSRSSSSSSDSNTTPDIDNEDRTPMISENERDSIDLDMVTQSIHLSNSSPNGRQHSNTPVLSDHPSDSSSFLSSSNSPMIGVHSSTAIPMDILECPPLYSPELNAEKNSDNNNNTRSIPKRKAPEIKARRTCVLNDTPKSIGDCSSTGTEIISTVSPALIHHNDHNHHHHRCSRSRRMISDSQSHPKSVLRSVSLSGSEMSSLSSVSRKSLKRKRPSSPHSETPDHYSMNNRTDPSPLSSSAASSSTLSVTTKKRRKSRFLSLSQG